MSAIPVERAPTSVMSFPDRGPWGKASWRGNCSGHVYREIFEHLQPQFFIDPMVGSGTSVEVAKEMGIEALGLDLHSGFSILRDSILSRANGREADLILSHPAYGGIIKYSGEVWGDKPHPDDLSRCLDDEDFLYKLEVALLNQRQATRPGGHYGMLIGDVRQAGCYVSYQAEMIARMPREELASIIVKVQHNVSSQQRRYRLKYPLIMHEYLILWQRKVRACLVWLAQAVQQQRNQQRGTWKSVVHAALIGLGGKAWLPDLYAYVAKEAPDKLVSNTAWKEKIRQTLQKSGQFTACERGVWQLA